MDSTQSYWKARVATCSNGDRSIISRDLSNGEAQPRFDSDLSVLLGVLGNVQDLKHKTCVVG